MCMEGLQVIREPIYGIVIQPTDPNPDGHQRRRQMSSHRKEVVQAETLAIRLILAILIKQRSLGLSYMLITV